MRRLGTGRGQSMVEFALLAPLLLFVLIGTLDFMRAIQINSMVADAARQGARQAVANGSVGDLPWGPADSNPCQGTTFVGGASGHGCLLDSRILETVKKVLAQATPTVTLAAAGTLASSCPTPAAGTAELCIAPSQNAAAAAYVDCPTAKTTLGHDPQPGELGGRQAEWGFPKFKGCFLVQVTVIYQFKPWTPYGPMVTLKSSTSMLGEEY
jgi:Flp pilus assembly protein TadG